MATRNKTAVFMKHRDGIRQTRPNASALSNHDHVVLEMSSHLQGGRQSTGYAPLKKVDSLGAGSASSSSSQAHAAVGALPPVWVDVSEKLKEDMAQIRAKMSELAKAQSRALLPTFGAESERGGGGRGGKPRNEHEEKIEVLTAEITRALKSCEQRLQRLSSSAGAGSRSGEDVAICRNIQRCMAADLQTLSMDFRRQSKQYLKRLQEQEQSTRPTQSQSALLGSHSGSSSNLGSSSGSALGGRGDSGLASESSLDDDDLSLDAAWEERRLLRAKQQSSVDQEREREIQEIFQSVHDLAQIMKDISVLVIDQGTIVDRIDHNIQTVSERVNKGVQQLQKAEQTQKRTAMMSCIMCLIAACLILFVLLILKELVLSI